MIFVDERNTEQKKTHTVIILMTDSFMSGWGGAGNGHSYAGWAVRPEMTQTMFVRIKSRGDAKRVIIVSGDYKPPLIEGHCHIYVADN